MSEIIYSEEKVIQENDFSLSLLEISLKNEIPHIQACGGNARCSTCRVIVLENIENLEPRNEAESKLAGIKGFEENIRLACQTKIKGSIKLRRLVIDKEDVEIAVVESGETTGREANIAILFSDIRGFTTFSEKALPYDAIHILNRYFNRMGIAVLENNGYIDKYIGDGLMALFGLNEKNPRNICLNAIKSALKMIDSLKELNVYLKSHFDYEFKIGIGIHFGNVILGELGHPGKRYFTAIGDSVNMASRIESTTKKTGTPFLVSKDLYEEVKYCVNRGRIFETKLKGKTGTYRLYEILSLKEEHRAEIDIVYEQIRNSMSLEDAPKFLRLAFHDSGNFDLSSGTGGANGSIRFEFDREENHSLATYFQKLEKIKTELKDKKINVSYSDLIAISGAVAVSKAGGPKINLRLGRIDANEAGKRMKITSSDISFSTLKTKFSEMGFSLKDLVVLSGAHTLGKSNGIPMTKDLYQFSNSYYKNLILFCNGNRNESLEILETDVLLLDTAFTKSLVELYAKDEVSFFSDFAVSFEKMTLLGQKKV